MSSTCDTAIANSQIMSICDATTANSQPVLSICDATIANSQTMSSNCDVTIANSPPMSLASDAATGSSQPMSSASDAGTGNSQPMSSTIDAAVGNSQPMSSASDAGTGNSQPMSSTIDAAVGNSQPMSSACNEEAIENSRSMSSTCDEAIGNSTEELSLPNKRRRVLRERQLDQEVPSAPKKSVIKQIHNYSVQNHVKKSEELRYVPSGSGGCVINLDESLSKGVEKENKGHHGSGILEGSVVSRNDTNKTHAAIRLDPQSQGRLRLGLSRRIPIPPLHPRRARRSSEEDSNV